MSISISWMGDCESFDDFIIFAQLKKECREGVVSMLSGLLFDECEKSIQMVDYSNYASGTVILK